MLLLALEKFPNGEEAKSERGKKEKRRNGKPAGPSTEGLLKVLAPDFAYLISINSGISPWTHLGGNTNTTALLPQICLLQCFLCKAMESMETMETSLSIPSGDYWVLLCTYRASYSIVHFSSFHSQLKLEVQPLVTPTKLVTYLPDSEVSQANLVYRTLI